MDDLIKEYLFFRGFQATLKCFDHELKFDKDRAFRADRIVEQLISFVHSHDYLALIEYWSYLDQKFFSQLVMKSNNGSVLSQKYELNLFRYFMSYAVQNNRLDKLIEFLDKLVIFLQGHNELRDWFSLPYVKNPEENPIFAVYFTPRWKEIFEASLQNFISMVFHNVKYPKLLLIEEELSKNKSKIKNQNPTYDEESWHEISDEFKPIQNDTKQSNTTGNSFISMLKNIGSKKSNNSLGNNNTSSIQTIKTPETTNQRYADSPFESLIKNFKSNKQKALASKTTSSQENEFKNSIENSKTSTPSTSNLTQTPSSRSENSNVEKQATNFDSCSNEPYLILSEDTYKEHKASVKFCKFSLDGKLIASVDNSGVLKIWSINQHLTTINTLMQKCNISALEWDSQNSSILYFGTKNGFIKLYEINSKKIIQELNVGSTKHQVTCLSRLNNLNGILVSVREEDSNSGFILICSLKKASNEWQIQGNIQTIQYHSVCVSPNILNSVYLGCNDGYIRYFNTETNEIVSSIRHDSIEITNLVISKTKTRLCTLSSDGKLNLWSINTKTLELNKITSQIIPFINSTSTFSIQFDSSENFIFIVTELGIDVYKILDKSIDKVQHLPYKNVTSIDLWNAAHSCILLASTCDGIIYTIKFLTS